MLQVTIGGAMPLLRPNTDFAALSLTTTALAMRALAPSTDFITGPAIAVGIAGGCWFLAGAWRHTVDTRVADDSQQRETSVKAARSEILDILVEAGLSQRDANTAFDSIKSRLAIVSTS